MTALRLLRPRDPVDWFVLVGLLCGLAVAAVTREASGVVGFGMALLCFGFCNAHAARADELADRVGLLEFDRRDLRGRLDGSLR